MAPQTYSVSTVQRHKHSRVDVSVTNIQRPSNLEKSTIQRYNHSREDVDVANLGVLEICKVYHTKIQKIKGGHWRYKLILPVKLAMSTIQQYQN